MEKSIKKKTNVLVLSVCYLPHYSGPSKQAHQINQQIIKKNINIIVITKNMNECSDVIDGINIIRLPKKGFKDYYFNKISTFLWAIQTSLYLIFKRKKIDIVHLIGSYFPSEIFTLVCYFIKKPLLVKNSIGRGAISTHRLHEKVRILILKKHANMISISQETHNELVNTAFKTNKVHYMPNGVNNLKFRPGSVSEKNILKNKLYIDNSMYIAINVGLKDKRKGTDILLKIWSKVVEKDRNVLLLLIGPCQESAFYSQIQRFITENKIKHNVLMLDNISNVEEYLRISDIFLFPSEREGLPNALLEAMSSALPCIARNIGGVTDLIRHGVNGLLCTETEEEKLISEFENHINMLKNDLDFSNMLGSKAREFVIENYSIDFIASKYYELYNRLIN